jgi:outer membrane protein OmpA-like peptidoglycan-associated protein
MLRTLPGLTLVAFVLVVPPAVIAQDEFDDEFYEDDEEAAEEAARQSDEESDEEIDAEQEAADEEEIASEDGAAREGPDPEEERWLRRFRLHPTFDGPSGGLRVVDARPAAERSMRMQLLLQFFAGGDFLLQGDDHLHAGGGASFSWAMHDWVEAFAVIESFSNTNTLEFPQLFQVVGDVRLGAKLGIEVNPWLSLGGDLSFYVPTNGDLDLAFDSWGIGIRANATADLRGLESPIPLIARLNLQYQFDNTAALAESVEAARYRALDDRLPPQDETRHLLSPVERLGLGVNRTDFFNIGLGAELAIEAVDDLFIHPFLEYTVGIPANRQGYDCAFVPSEPGSEVPAPGEDSCLAQAGASAIPMDFAIGVRVLPVVPGFAATMALELGITGTAPDEQVRELSGNFPWLFLIGVSYAFDMRPDPPPPIERREVIREVTVQDPPPPRGRIVGVVVDRETGAPVPLPIVHYPAREVTTQRGDDQGRFTSIGFPPSEQVDLEINHPEYLPGTCRAEFADPVVDVEVRCEIERAPPQVVVEDTEVVILEQINFAFDRAEILPSSFGLMDAIARTVNAHTEILRLEVQGHTDNRGTARYNQQLSQRRVDAVVQGLVERGVDPARLVGRGYGLSVPLVPNDTEENRARNRRVQFIIMERAPDQNAPAPAPDGTGTVPPPPSGSTAPPDASP